MGLIQKFRDHRARLDAERHNDARRVSPWNLDFPVRPHTFDRAAPATKSQRHVDTLDLGSGWESPPVKVELVGDTREYTGVVPYRDVDALGFAVDVPQFRAGGLYEAKITTEDGQSHSLGLAVKVTSSW